MCSNNRITRQNQHDLDRITPFPLKNINRSSVGLNICCLICSIKNRQDIQTIIHLCFDHLLCFLTTKLFYQNINFTSPLAHILHLDEFVLDSCVC